MIGALFVAALAATSVQSQEAAPAVETSGPVLSLPSADPGARDEDSQFLDTASTYAAYHAEVNAAGRREISSGLDLDTTMDALAVYYSDDRLVDAQIAYAALVAAQNPEFIDAVRAVADYYGRDVAIAGMTNDPLYLAGFMGADAASQSVVGAINQDVDQINEVGQRYRAAAYNLQSSSWAQQRARDRAARLAALETASSRLQTNFRLADDTAGQASALTAHRLGAASSLFEGDIIAGPSGPVTLPDLEVTVGNVQLQPDERRVGQILAVAALESIEAGDMAAMDNLLANPTVARCIAWARLDLQQCVAAGHFKYEDAFCIAQHALDDVGTCLTASRAVSN